MCYKIVYLGQRDKSNFLMKSGKEWIPVMPVIINIENVNIRIGLR
jgi:hypothetical protein